MGQIKISGLAEAQPLARLFDSAHFVAVDMSGSVDPRSGKEAHSIARAGVLAAAH